MNRAKAVEGESALLNRMWQISHPNTPALADWVHVYAICSPEYRLNIPWEENLTEVQLSEKLSAYKKIAEFNKRDRLYLTQLVKNSNPTIVRWAQEELNKSGCVIQ